MTSCSTRSSRLSTRSTYLTAFSIRSNRLSTRSARLFTGSLRLPTRNTCLSIRFSTYSTRLSTSSASLSFCSITKLALELAPFPEKWLYGKFSWFPYVLTAFLMTWVIIFGQKCLSILLLQQGYFLILNVPRFRISHYLTFAWSFERMRIHVTLFSTFLSSLSVCISWHGVLTGLSNLKC